MGGKKIASDDTHFSLHDAGKWKDEYTKRMEKPQKKTYIVERQGDGKVKLHQPSLAGVGAAGGALWGGLIGLIFFMPLFGMAIGAATGAAAGALSDSGVDDDFMKRLGSELEPGKSAVIVLVRSVTADKVLPNIKEPGKIIQTSLNAEDEGALQQALDVAGAGA